MISDDPFYQTQQGEIYQKSQYIIQEHAVANLFKDISVSLGYARIDNTRPIWKRDNKKILICLADDFSIHSQHLFSAPQHWFDADTTIITDNYLPVSTPYKICQLPSSYFGVFSYTPTDQDYRPGARFHFSVNRFDTQRLHILLEFIAQAGPLEQILNKDYVNFNCWDPASSDHSIPSIKNTVINAWEQMPQIHSAYNDIFQNLAQQVPLRNHNMFVEQAHVSSQLNLVIETYAGANAIAFSEKTFRALATPAPWTLFSAKNAIQRLRTLGFDVLDDLINHNGYDQCLHNDQKIKHYISTSIQAQKNLENQKFSDIKNRCQQAAVHNRQILYQMKLNWPSDLGEYMLGLIQQIKT